MKAKKRLLSLLLCGAMLFSLCPQVVSAEGVQDSGKTIGGLCEHHPAHNESCGYTEGTPGTPCNHHEHTDECYTEVTSCVHEHTADCYPAESVSGNTATPSEADEAEPICGHVCSEESGCIKGKLDCQHEHSEACGYAPATEGTPCGYVCEICKLQDSGPTSGQSVQKPEEEVKPDGDACICTGLCSEDSVNPDCPVCRAEGADLTLCKGAETATPSNAAQLSAGDVQKLIDKLPTADELAAMSLEEQQAVYTKLQAAYEAYNALTDEQKAEVTGAEIFDSLFEVFNSMVNMLADGSITEAGIRIAYSNGGNATYSAGNGFQIASSGDYTISGMWNGSITGAGDLGSQKYVITVSGNITANITIQGLTINVSGTDYVGAFVIKDNATVNLTLSGENSLNSGKTTAGLEVSAGTNLVIKGTGSLMAACPNGFGAGIGVGDLPGGGDCGDITINGGTITAIGGMRYPGIGTGLWESVSSSSVTINGGTVTAIGGDGAAGIGHSAAFGYNTSCAVTISGGTVTAIGGGALRGGSVANGIDNRSKQSEWNGSILVIGRDDSGIYGGDSFTLQEDFEISSGKTLNIGSGKTLNVSNGVTLTNNGSITGSGTLDGSGDLKGSGTIADTITNKLRKDSAVNVEIDPSKAVYGSTVTITAEISKKENALTRSAAQNKVDFYLGTVDSGTFLESVNVSDNTATLQVSLNDEKWTAGQHTITAEYGGSMTLKSESGTATLNVTKAGQNGSPTVSVSETTADSITVSANGSGQGNIQYACVLGENASVPTEGWRDSNIFSDRDPGTAYTVFARYAGNEYYEPSSASDGVTVYTAAKKPATSDVFIDYTAETISFAATLEVNTAENFDRTAITSGNSIKDYFGSTLYVRVKENGNIPASEPLPLAIPSRPTAPSVSVNYGEETLSTTTAMQYASSTSGQSVQRWETCGEDMAATAFGWDGSAEVTVKFRTAATDSAFASSETIVTIPARLEAPAAPVVADRTSSSIEVTAVSGQEYKLNEEEWQTPTGSSIIFDGLEAGESYTIYTRIKATASQFASAEASVATSTKEGAAAAPTVGDPTVTVSTVTLPQNSAWEYSTDGNSWSGTYHFEGLYAATKYTYYIRVKETENAEASLVAVVPVYTAKEAPNEGIGYKVIYETETLTVTGGYEVNTAQDFTGTAIPNGGSIQPGGTYYVRAAASDDVDGLTIPCSKEVGFTLDNRPNAPDNLQGTNETFADEEDGKITGTSSDMEYRLSSSDDWKSCSGDSLTDLAPGTYLVRYKATDSAFASAEAAVEIKTGEQRTYTLNVTAPAFNPVTYGYTQPEAKAITINNAGNSNSTISSVTVDNKNFVIGGSGSAVTAGGSIRTWTIQPAAGLNVGTHTATITVNYTGGAKATAQVSFTVSQAEQAAPDKGPELASRDRNSITLTAVPDNENGAKAEYSRDGGAGWQTSPVFTGLSSGTTYSFIVRYGATADGNYKASPASPAAEYSTEKSGGGGGGGTSYDYFTITASAVADGSISPSGSVSVREGRDKTFTITPDSGYRISDVLVDGRSVGAVSSYTFDNVQKRHTIEAVFAKENLGTGVDNPFTDVHPGDWFYDDVMFVYQNGLMSGTSATTFEPYTVTTRAQLAVIFYRMDGSPEVIGDSPFTDVEYGPGTTWYYDAVLWAYQKGIVAGYGDHTYHPGAPVTREQLAVMFRNYANYKGYSLTATNDLSGFTDAGSVSDWALEAVKWAVGNGLINGYGDGTLKPQGTATRAEVAAMLHNFIERNHLVPPAVIPGGDGGAGGTGTGGGGGWTQQLPAPQTGDNTPIWPFVALPVSAAGLAGCAALRYRQRKSEDEYPIPQMS